LPSRMIRDVATMSGSSSTTRISPLLSIAHRLLGLANMPDGTAQIG
jgi:hypothetical protein